LAPSEHRLLLRLLREVGKDEDRAEQTVSTLMASWAGDSPYLALAVVFLGCVVMTNLITNAAAAAFMFPIALAVVGNLHVIFMPFVIVLMLGTSYAFINPESVCRSRSWSAPWP
jgi:di/tricarboxylate transporter